MSSVTYQIKKQSEIIYIIKKIYLFFFTSLNVILFQHFSFFAYVVFIKLDDLCL